MSNLRTDYQPRELIKSSDFNDVNYAILELQNKGDGYATKNWVENKSYLTEHLSLDEYTKTEDLAAVATTGSYNDLEDKPDIDLSVFDLVSELPTGDAINTNKVYLLKDSSATEGDVDIYDLWKYIDGALRKLGSYKTSIDLSGYVEKQEGKGLFSGSYNDLTNKPNLGQYVTLDTTQTISGNKTFTNAVKIQGDGRIQSTTDAGAIRLFGGTTQLNGASFIFHGKDYSYNEWKGSFDVIANNGSIYKELIGKPDGTLTWTGNTIVVKNNANTGTIRVDSEDSVVVSDKKVYIRPTNEINNYGNGNGVCFDFTDKDVTPETNKEISLGEPNHQFNNIYGNTIYQNGNLVANKTDLDSYVTLGTDLTISGSKTFSKDIILKSSTGDSLGVFRTNGSNELIISDGKAIYFRNTNDKISTTDHGFKLEFKNQSGTETNALKPETNEGLNLGLSGYQFNNIYGKTIYLNGKLVANKEDLNSYETSQHASNTYVNKSAISTKELVFIKEDGSTETIKSIVEV